MTVGEHLLFEVYFGVEKELASKLIPTIRENEANLISVCNCVVPRKAFLRLYRLGTKIEELPQEEKKELKEWVLNRFKGNVEWLTDTCRIVHTIGNLI
jgi:hypothetical protein